MLRPLLSVLLLLHYLQGQGYCSAASSLQGAYSESKPDVDRSSVDHPSSVSDIQSALNSSADGERAVLMRPSQVNSMIKQQDLTATSADNRRQRRHIGSIAAFRGLPGPFNKFNPVEWPLSAAGWDRKAFPLTGSDKMLTPGSNLADLENSYSDVIKDKRFPEDSSTSIQKNSQPPNPVLMRNNPGTGSGSGMNKNYEIVPPPHNEARARAVNRLLRLLSEAKAKSARVNSISKKFLGALARSNALPTPQTTTKTVVPLVQYKGSIAIPLPGKRTSINSGMTRSAIEFGRSEPTDATVENLEFNSQAINDSVNDIYNDDVDFAEATEDQIDEYDENIATMKRNIAALAAKGGLHRPSRTYNRIPQISF